MSDNQIDVQPSAEEAEQAILASILMEPESIERAIPWISSPKAFWFNKNQTLWVAMCEMHKQKIGIDLVTLRNFCKEHHPSAEIFYMSTISNVVASSWNIHHYAKTIQEKYLQRQFDASLKKLKDKNLRRYDENILIEHQKILENLRTLQPKKNKSIDDLVDDTLEHIEKSDNLIKWNKPYLDKLSGGATRGELTALGGRPSHGKSTLCINILEGILDQGLKVILFNREMNNIEMLKKLITLISPGLSYTNVRQQNLSKVESTAIEEAGEFIKDKYKNLILYDKIKTMEEAASEIKLHKPDIVIDDYIQKIIVNGSKDRRFQLEDIMNEYSWIAKDNNLHVITVSQLNREVEKRTTNPRPRMSDFAESGAIEQVCETAIFPFRGFVFDHHKFGKNEFELIAAKVRYGDPKTILIGFNGNRCKMYPTEMEAKLGT